MGVRVLDDGMHSTLYDSVSMWSFGPVVYNDDVDLHDFMEWLTEEDYDDPRSLTEKELQEAFDRYQDEA